MMRDMGKKPWAALSVAGLFLTAIYAVAGSPQESARADRDSGKLIVHEWGTFLSVQGSDGVTLGGMIESLSGNALGG